MSEVILRSAQKSDCEEIAHLINVSAAGVLDYLLNYICAEGIAAVKYMSELLTREGYYSYSNTVVAESGRDLLGMALSFPAGGLIINENMQKFYTQDRLQYIRYFVDNKIKDSCHLDAIAVQTAMRGKGIGQKLLENVIQQAQYFKFSVVQAFVFASNEKAVKFYLRKGFLVDKAIDVCCHPFLQNKNSLLLMRYDLSAN